MPTVPPDRDRRQHELEVLYRLDSVRSVAEAILMGLWMPEPAVLAELGHLVAAAEAWSRRAA